MRKKVFVSGCFDLLHSGHIAFLKEAASYGELAVGLGSDKNIFLLKNKVPVNTQEERLFNVQSIKYVTEAFINGGTGMLDFVEELRAGNYNIFFVNEEGHTKEKRMLCEALAIEYIVGKRIPYQGLDAQSTTHRMQSSPVPYRIDLAGGWLDQPFVSKHFPGMVITVSIEPDAIFSERSGLATSTRKRAIELWNNSVPFSSERNARILFCYENYPGKEEISGSQDAIGIILPGMNYLSYSGNYWPHKIEPCVEEDTLHWLEEHLFLLPLSPRRSNYNVLSESNISEAHVKRLAAASEKCLKAIATKDVNLLGLSLHETMQAQIRLFPKMTNSAIKKKIEEVSDKVAGCKLTGAGGGGYLICAGQPNHFPEAIKIKIRRKDVIFS